MIRKVNLFLLVFINILVACKGHNKQKQEDVIPAGKMTERVECRADPSFTYSIYLPSGYTDKGKFPVILAFDPHGSGSLPVSMYKDLAEKYGYVIAGSDNSKNGQDLTVTMATIRAMLIELKSRYAIDLRRIYTMGFSGGARVAVLAAFDPGGIAGVTGSGAGFPNTGSNFPYMFDYLGMAGTFDFNMYEMIQLDKYLDQSGTNHALILFDGIHEWPPVQVMEQSFLWNDMCAMRRGTLSSDQKEISAYKKIMDEKLKVLSSDSDPLMLARDLQNLVRFLNSLTDVSNYSQQLARLQQSDNYQKALTRQMAGQQKEMEEQHMLNDNFFKKDTTWWRNKINSWEKIVASSRNKDEVMMTKRLRSYLSLVCYMKYMRALEAHEQQASDHAMKIYEMTDPEHAAETKK